MFIKLKLLVHINNLDIEEILININNIAYIKKHYDPEYSQIYFHRKVWLEEEEYNWLLTKISYKKFTKRIQKIDKKFTRFEIMDI